jgi:hypothetical protein
MFWVTTITATLCYVALFSIMERISKMQWVLVRAARAGHHPSKIQLDFPQLAFKVIGAYNSYFVMVATMAYLRGTISPETFYGLLPCVAGYSLYSVVVPSLYQEVSMVKTQKMVSLLMIPALYVYSFGGYSRIYTLVSLLGVSHIYDLYSELYLPKDLSPNPIKTWINRFDLSVLSGLLVWSIGSLDFLFTIFFGGLIGTYFGLA